MSIDHPGSSTFAARLARIAAAVPWSGVALLVSGVLFIAGTWLATGERIRTERVEALESEVLKNANLALAVEAQANQMLKGIDQFLVLIKSQHERPGPRVPLAQLVGPAFPVEHAVTLIGVIDSQGEVVEAITAYTADNAADRAMFRVHRQADSGAMLLSAPVLGRLSGRWVIPLSRRINRPDGTFGGLVVISVEPRYLTSLFESTMIGPSDVMSLVLENGMTLARRRGPVIEFSADISGSQLMAEYAVRRVGDFVGPGGVDGHLRIFSYRRLEDYPVVATVGTSEADALAPVGRRTRTYYRVASAVSVAIGLVCAVGVGALIRQQRVNRRLLEQASLLDEAQDAIMVIGIDRRLTYWNKSAERLYGWPAATALGRTVPELLYPHGDAAAADQAYDQVTRTGEWLGELQPSARTGRRVTTQSRLSLVRDARGLPVSILAIDTDVTERRQLEQQFYRAQRLESIGTLAGGIAHDLNNMLAPIMLATELLREQATDDGTRELLGTIGDSARRGAEMVGQVLSFARGQGGRRAEVVTAHLVEEVVRIARDALPKDIAIVTRVAPSLPSLVGDPTQFHQVLLNLCVNARDAMPDGGTLTISAEAITVPDLGETLPGDVAAGDYLMLQVEDTGTGMPADLLEQIFDPFFTTKAPGKGTGLGLSTSQAIVKNHGGQIQVYSEPGRGTRFRIYLPTLQTARAGPLADADRPLARGSGETVLVVDDEPAIRRITTLSLEAFGYRVLVAANGAEALTLYQQRRAEIAVVITDMMMPVLGGEGLIRALVELDPAVRIIAVSGINSNEALAREASPNVVRFLIKPFTAATVMAALQDVLSAPSD